MSAELRLLRLLHLASPALPIGAFHFSQGLEAAVDARWVSDASSAHAWIDGLAASTLASLDLPIVCRLHAAWTVHDLPAVQHWNAVLLAARESAELRAEERHLGTALSKVLRELDVAVPAGKAFGYAAMFALACSVWAVEPLPALQTYAWVWLENQVLAAVKLVPLGQSAGQRIVHQLIPHLAVLAAGALQIADEHIGTCAPRQVIASCRHETQYSRLFRS